MNVMLRIHKLLFSPRDPRPLGLLRIFLGSALFAEALTWAPNLSELFGQHGFVNAALQDYLVRTDPMRIDRLSAWFGVAEYPLLKLVFAAYLAALLFFIAGYHTRLAAFATWLTFRVLYSSSPLSVYGVDHYAAFFLFYFLAMPIGESLSLDVRQGRASRAPSAWAGFSIQLLRLHLTLTYLAAGIAKARGTQWWTGEAIWRALNLPMFSTTHFGWLSSYEFLAQLAGWGTLAMELGYPLLLWPRRTRPFGVIAIVLLHAGIAGTMGLISFGVVMSIFTITLFGGERVRSAALA